MQQGERETAEMLQMQKRGDDIVGEAGEDRGGGQSLWGNQENAVGGGAQGVERPSAETIFRPLLWTPGPYGKGG